MSAPTVKTHLERLTTEAFVEYALTEQHTAVEIAMLAENADLRARIAELTRPTGQAATTASASYECRCGRELNVCLATSCEHFDLAPAPSREAAPLDDARILEIAAEQDYGDEDPKCILRLAKALLRAAQAAHAGAEGGQSLADLKQRLALLLGEGNSLLVSGIAAAKGKP
jgi:hypothetical protein